MNAAPTLRERIVREDGFFLRENTYDRMILREVYKYGQLEPGPSDVVLDIGANFGAATRLFADAAVKLIVAIEPEAENFRLLEMNTRDLPGRLTLIGAAVARCDRTATLWVNKGRNKGMHSLVRSPKRRAHRVECISLTRLLAEYRPTLLKIDIEGGEYDLIEDLERLPSRVRGIALELHFHHGAGHRELAARLVAALASQGFVAKAAPQLAGTHPCTLGVWLRTTPFSRAGPRPQDGSDRVRGL